MHIPSKFRAGFQSLDSKQENFINKLILNAAGLAGEVYYDVPEVKQAFNQLKIDKKDEDRILVELTIFNIFLTSLWIAQNYKNKSRVLLDRLYYVYQMDMMAKKDKNKYDDFYESMLNRYKLYDSALRNKTASGPGYWIPNAVVKCILSTDDLDRYDPKSCIILTINFGSLMKVIPESINEIFEEIFNNGPNIS